MDLHSSFVADRLHSQQAAALDHDIERRRSLIDRGAVLAPERPVVSALTAVGLWLRLRLRLQRRSQSRSAAFRPRLSH